MESWILLCVSLSLSISHADQQLLRMPTRLKVNWITNDGMMEKPRNWSSTMQTFYESSWWSRTTSYEVSSHFPRFVARIAIFSSFHIIIFSLLHPLLVSYKTKIFLSVFAVQRFHSLPFHLLPIFVALFIIVVVASHSQVQEISFKSFFFILHLMILFLSRFAGFEAFFR